ncbi:MAG: sugar phosphate isomerase/epimerase [Armatimonadetes bacterium]|nr:sugar phosphate isomerase/epimerase [Armatimonadota bacterium]
MPDIPIAVQLYSVRDDCAKDFPGTLKAVADMGYAGVEFAGYYGYSAEELRTMLSELGLKCAGTHTGLDTITAQEIGTTIEFNKALGNRFLIVPGLPAERTSSRDAWLETARMFSQSAELAVAEGMRVGYHNHHIEFQALDGEWPWDTFFSNTPKEVVMQLDTGNALVGGADPAPILKRYPGRALTVHLKEHSATNDKALVGEGDVNWPLIFDLCENIGSTEWYIVEQESYPCAPLEAVAKCLENLRKMGK